MKLWVIIIVVACVLVTLASAVDLRCSAVRPAQNLVVVACGAGRMAR